jgi:hypothetical protein
VLVVWQVVSALVSLYDIKKYTTAYKISHFVYLGLGAAVIATNVIQSPWMAPQL